MPQTAGIAWGNVVSIDDNGGSLTVDGATSIVGAVNLYAPPALASATQGPIAVTVTTTAATQLIAAPGAGLSIYVTDLYLTNSGTDTVVSFREGAAGTIRISLFTGKTAANGTMPLNIPWKLPANTALAATMTVASVSVFVNVQYFVAA